MKDKTQTPLRNKGHWPPQLQEMPPWESPQLSTSFREIWNISTEENCLNHAYIERTLTGQYSWQKGLDPDLNLGQQ